ncbi:MAG: acylphosphatase [Candidatus Krumholzibacteria bacterium]|nr:acylphosphatase [Candidatus Krumholzibacteria bacterium]MDH4335951.1 acylphosphatase [Candidatus Krumholzibacteria bacterium]MDH5268473.1 acylphosphatase [Candidatus Krumholzibacteria bacterium]MDH5627699.1 acylphosphatase [Candidatus Krumholzibacteria bacterium]
MHAWVSGRVQGVFFRDSTRQRARELGLAGWVKNLPDGRVEALFVGTREACEAALAFVRIGPPAAAVSAVEWVWEEPPAHPAGGFSIA